MEPQEKRGLADKPVDKPSSGRLAVVVVLLGAGCIPLHRLSGTLGSWRCVHASRACRGELSLSDDNYLCCSSPRILSGKGGDHLLLRFSFCLDSSNVFIA